MPDYRDYGFINDSPNRNIPVDTFRRGQVYQATHDGVGLRLPLMNRSFISFSYGDRLIEDFNLIATISNDRLERAGYASFTDNTTTYANLDGQKYWGTHFGNNTFHFILATDGMEQKLLDDFLYWFRPGDTKELILAEHPNRAILARVAEPPQLSLLPFEENVTIPVNENYYKGKTTLYRGEINLTLVADDPHWYSKRDVLGILDGNRYLDYWETPDGAREYIFASQDALKILYEDGIPLGSMINDSMILSNGAFANTGTLNISKIWSVTEDYEDYNTNPEYFGARIDTGDGTMGIIAGAIIDAAGNGIAILNNKDASVDNAGFFYYAGTAPAFTKLRFTLTPELATNTHYVITPRNSHSDKTVAQPNEYNTITVESRLQQNIMFTTPNVYTSYNRALDIFSTYISSNYSWEDIRSTLRENVRHSRIREWAIRVVNCAEQEWTTESGTIASNVSIQTIKDWMSLVLLDENGNPYPITITCNSETGEVIGEFTMRVVDMNVDPTPQNISQYGNFVAQKEDVGDMLRSNHLIIRERNYPDEYGRLQSWKVSTEVTKSYSHRITHDVNTPLTNLTIFYKHMYL